MTKAAKIWILILTVGLVAGLIGVIENGWQNPGDTIGVSVWLVLALCVALMIRESRKRS